MNENATEAVETNATAETEGAATQGTNGTQNTENGVQGTDGTQTTTDKGYSKDELNSAVNKAIEDAKKQWKQEADEAAELAKLSKEAREKKIFENDKEKFEAEKAKFAHDKLVLETEKQLSGKKLPSELAELLTGKDADSTLKNIESFEKAFSKAVEAAVDERLKADPPKIFGGGRTQTDPFLSGFTE